MWPNRHAAETIPQSTDEEIEEDLRIREALERAEKMYDPWVPWKKDHPKRARRFDFEMEHDLIYENTKHGRFEAERFKFWMPLFVPTGGRPSELLPGAPECTRLCRSVATDGMEVERYTSIERMKLLALSHPWVVQVFEARTADIRWSCNFGGQGRAKRHCGSSFVDFLEIILETYPFELVLITGCIVHPWWPEHLCLWWSPVDFNLGSFVRRILDDVWAFFYDITETRLYLPGPFVEYYQAPPSAAERMREWCDEAGVPIPNWAWLGPQQESSPPPPQPQPPQHALVATDGQEEPPPGEPLALDVSMPQPPPPSP